MTQQTESDPYISIFTPSQTDVEDLEAIFVQREDLLTDAIERIVESATTKNKHHQLMVGSRGSGKTHLVTLLVHRLNQQKALKKKLKIAWLNEDETFASLLDILLKIFISLQKRYPKEYASSDIESVYDMKPKDAQAFVGELIVDKLKASKQTCLVIIENLDAMFEAIGKQGQEQLRAYIQENPRFTFFVSAQKLTQSLKDREKPFFGFFQTEYLEALNEEEASKLISNIAKLNHKKDVSQFLKTRQGKMRIKALHHLSGGNHRMYIVLSQFISRDTIDALVAPFLKMVDELTPYYQERIRWLPPAQRKIIELLSATRNTVSVKRMARQLFSSNQSISSQLKDLKDKGYVKSHKRGRESLYEITEPLMRICVEVKENQDNRPIAILVDFIRAWYDNRDIKSKLDGKISKTGQLYLETALEQGSFIDELYRQKSQTKDQPMQGANNKIRESDENADLHIQTLTKIINAKNNTAEEVANALFKRSGLFYFQADFESATKDYTQIIELENIRIEQVAKALINRGVTYGQQGEIEKKLSDYTHVIELADAPVEQVARALFNRGVTYGQQGEIEKELLDYTHVIELADAPVEQVAKALIYRGVTYGQQGESEKALSDFARVTELTDHSLEKNIELLIKAYTYSAEVFITQSQWKQAIAFLSKGLLLGKQGKEVEDYAAINIINAAFNLNMDTPQRISRIAELVACYKDNKTAMASLGVGLINHLGILNRKKSKPLNDNLNAWLEAWDLALKERDEMTVTRRLFSVGMAFLQSEENNEEILLDLIESERIILQQAFDLDNRESR